MKRQISFGALVLLGVAVACDGRGANPAVIPANAPLQDASYSSIVPAGEGITLMPPSLKLTGTGKAHAKTVTVGEPKYRGQFTEKSTCKGVASATPTFGKGPSFKVKVTGIKAGSCSITFADAKKHRAKLPITVSVATPSPSPSPSPTGLYIVYNFGNPDAQEPVADLATLGGVLYGTTKDGGTNGQGAVFSLTPSGTETVLHSFGGSGDGSQPVAGMVVLNGLLFGTTVSGGANNDGTVFSITPSGTESVLYSFKAGTDGQYPYGNLAVLGGVLYGTTRQGGTASAGTVFSLTTGGSETVLHSFRAYPGSFTDASGPYSGLTALGGLLYGTSYVGGTGGGTVYSITTSGSESVLYNFKGGSDGYFPSTSLIALGGILYGTTEQGGGAGSCSYGGCGTVFSITTGGTETVLHGFGNGSDGTYPYSDLTAVGSTLYGTTNSGGTANLGTVFSVTTGGTESVLHSFTGHNDGNAPSAGLLLLNGLLYGTTQYGGPNGIGDVFALPPT